MKIGVIGNPTKKGVTTLLKDLNDVCDQAGVELILEKQTAKLIKERGVILQSLLKKIDLLMVAGGDGSLLRVLHRIYPTPVPLLGINIGNLGFLTAITREEILDTAVDILKGVQPLRLSPRLVLQATVRSARRRYNLRCALNDIVLFRGNSSRVVRMRVYLDDLLVNEYAADGLIVATPTGSTAYALAAGGPIISPETKAFYLSPICSHSLSNRGLVFSPGSVMRVEIPSQCGPVMLQSDGRASHQLQSGDSLEISVGKDPVILAFLENKDFFQILRQKLKWSGASV